MGTSDADYRMEQMSAFQLLLTATRISTVGLARAVNSMFLPGCLYCMGVFVVLCFGAMLSLMSVQEGYRTRRRVLKRVLICFIGTVIIQLLLPSFLQPYLPAWGMLYTVFSYALWIWSSIFEPRPAAYDVVKPLPPHDTNTKRD